MSHPSHGIVPAMHSSVNVWAVLHEIWYMCACAAWRVRGVARVCSVARVCACSVCLCVSLCVSVCGFSCVALGWGCVGSTIHHMMYLRQRDSLASTP